MKSKIALLFISIFYLISFTNYANYNNLLKGGGDCWGYYAYLPATFIYHDLDDLQNTINKRAEYNPNSINGKIENRLIISEAHAHNKNTIIKYTNGVAILTLPFFLVAHYFCKITHLFPADGYSSPYNFAISLATLIYSLIGLWFLRKILIKYFSDTITAVTLLSIGIGTNLYYFSTLNLGMSHPFLFTLYAILIYATDNFYETKKLKHTFLIGFSLGMITLIRPTEIIVVLIPILYNIFSIEDLKNRIHFYLRNYKTALLITFICVLVNLPQLLYWKLLTSKWIYYSYTDEGFNFLHPHIKNGLFGFRNGWLSYTPILIFSIIGLFFFAKYYKKFALIIFIFLPIHIYIIYSWHCWFYINGFGSRPMVETYPLLAISFAALLTAVWKNHILKSVTVICLIFFAWINIFQTWQFHKGLIWTEEGNFAFYKAIFLKSKGSPESLIAFDCGESQPDISSIHFVQLLKADSFEDSTSIEYINDTKSNGKFAFELKNSQSPKNKFIANQSLIKPKDYIKITLDIYAKEMEWNKYKFTVLNTLFFHNGNIIRDRKLRLPSKIDNKENSIWHAGEINQWQTVSYFVKVPHRFVSSKDVLEINVWNPSDKKFVIDNLRIELWKSN